MANPTPSSATSRTGIFTQLSTAPLTEERLPFTIRIAESEEDIEKAVWVRYAAYSRHSRNMPEIAPHLRAPEPYDYEEDSTILLAESKLDGSALGSIRIQTNFHSPLKLESSIKLPSWLHHSHLAEAGRLGIVSSKIGRLVKVLLFKAYYFYCLQEEISWMVITARHPVDRDYESLMFQDVFPEKHYIPMDYDESVPCRVMSLEVESVKPNWYRENHPLYNLFFEKSHPDLNLTQHSGRRNTNKSMHQNLYMHTYLAHSAA